MSKIAVLATCALNQWALDFEGNVARILESIMVAKERGAALRVGPELEICGYGCDDHFLEADTFMHSWEGLCKILQEKDLLANILCDIGMPIIYKNVRYNCRVFIYNAKIILIRPKMVLANGGNYRESRWFSAWQWPRITEQFALPEMVGQICEQTLVPIGDAVIEMHDTCIGAEICEELFAPNTPHIAMALDGVEIFTNGSASHHELGKLHRRVSLIKGATANSGGVYLYANQIGSDGERPFYDASAMISLNGNLIAQGSQFTIVDVEVVTAVVDLADITVHRGASQSFVVQAASSQSYPRVYIDAPLGNGSVCVSPTPPMKPRYHTPQEEIELGPACWMWAFLTMANASGFFLPLSGGLDSCSCALIIYSMCRIVHQEAIVHNGQKTVQRLCKILGVKDLPADFYSDDGPKAIAKEILHTVYMETGNSSEQSRDRSATLAAVLNSYHLAFNFNGIVQSVIGLFTTITGLSPRFRSFGGSNVESLALQNVQGRLRMVLAYFFAQLLPCVRGKPSFNLVVGSSNCDEALVGYYTKYDNSSADLCPIGSISKVDLRSFVVHMQKKYPEFEKALADILAATPSAELEPTIGTACQTDEDDIGMTYEEVSMFGLLRGIKRCGPYSAFKRLCTEWTPLGLNPGQIAEKVKKFFTRYSANRHKTDTLTPSYHAQGYSPDQHRFDLRPFLYRINWPWQFRRIDEAVEAQQAVHLPVSEDK